MNAAEIGFFSFTEKVQKVCGFGTTHDGAFKIENRSRFFLFVIYPVVIFYPTEIIMTVYNTNNLTNFIKAFTNFLTHFGITYKVITYYVNHVDIFYCITVMKHQKYALDKTHILFKEHKIIAEKWSKALLIAGSLICFFMAACALYIVVFDYRPLEESDVILFPDFGNTRHGFTLFWLYQIFPLAAFLWCTVGKFEVYTTLTVLE